MNNVKSSLILACALLLTACTFSGSPGAELAGTRWELVEISGQDLLDDTFISLEFEEGRVTGSAGCNAYGAAYSLPSASDLSIMTPEANEADCQDPEGVMAQEGEYLHLLEEIGEYQLQGDRLSFADVGGDVILLYQRIPSYDNNPDDLIGRTWQLASADGLARQDLAAFTVTFEGDRFHGTTVCRDYEGRFQMEGDELQVTFLQMTSEVDCDAEALEAEGEYTTLFSNAERFHVGQNRLELFTRRGKTVRFEMSSGG